MLKSSIHVFIFLDLFLKHMLKSQIYDYCRKKGLENTVMRDYVLPDYTHIKRGYVRPQEETTGRAQGNEQVTTFVVLKCIREYRKLCEHLT